MESQSYKVSADIWNHTMSPNCLT